MKQIKKTISTVLVSASLMSFAQVNFGVKANLLYRSDSPSWTSIKNGTTTVFNEKGENSAGYNFGVSAKIDTPLVFLYNQNFITLHLKTSSQIL